MKARIYIRVARGHSANRVGVGITPNYRPLSETRGGVERDLPTAMFALDLEVPVEALKRAEQVAATVALDAAAAQVLVSPVEVAV